MAPFEGLDTRADPDAGNTTEPLARIGSPTDIAGQ